MAYIDQERHLNSTLYRGQKNTDYIWCALRVVGLELYYYD